MKKLILTGMAVMACLLFLPAYVKNVSAEKVFNASFTNTATIACAPPVTITAADFEKRYKPSVVMVRKNVYSLSATEINSIKTGVTNMKALVYTNATSWEYQAAIHGTTRSDGLPSWNNCHRSGEAFFFLAWHRMYVYFFERILRAKSGNPNLTLPYWDYQTNAVIPPDWRNSAAGNPLYDGTRSATLNAGGSLPVSIMTDIVNALSKIPYYDFQSYLNGPHGSVHTTINGNMHSTSTAAKDPVFWLHHCNIDRLWEVWLRKCGGRANPIDAAWLNDTYTFFDETGTAVNMKGSDVVATASTLNYKYDFSTINLCNIHRIDWIYATKLSLIKKPLPIILDGDRLKASFFQEKTDVLDNFIRTNKKTRFDFVHPTAPEKLIITLKDIQVDKFPEGVVEVYMNLPDGQVASSNSKYFVGLLDLFSVEHHSKMKGMMGMGNGYDVDLDASIAAQAQGLTPADLKKAEISFVVRGNTLKGREVKTTAKLNVKGIDFSIQQLKK